MLNKLLHQLRSYEMLSAGDRVYCAVSGGADSMALLWGLYLLREKLGITLLAAHFNHGLRGEESQRDEDFVREFCDRFEIPLELGHGAVVSGKKGLEAAARDARYAFFDTLPGKVATAHTADDNAETVLMHLIRGTGLKGLGGIAPVRGKLIRPMLTVTRQQVVDFLGQYHLSWVEDSTNATDLFLRNRVRHKVMPLLKAENPSLSENLSRMAMELRLDEELLSRIAGNEENPKVAALREMPKAQRSRVLAAFMKENGVREPDKEHIALAEKVVFSKKPSARVMLPGGVELRRNYDFLEIAEAREAMVCIALPREGEVILEELGLRMICEPAQEIVNSKTVFTVEAKENLVVRARERGDEIRLPGGTRTLKKLFIDRKIPAGKRAQIPVIADDDGVVAIYGIGVNEDRAAVRLPACQIRFEEWIPEK